MDKGRALERVLRRVAGWLFALLALAIVGARPVLAQDPPVTFTPVADAYVLDGAWSNNNFGSDVWLYTKTSNGQKYDSYLKFDTAGVGSVSRAKLRFNASVSANANIGVTAHSVAATGWSESAITWNNKPALGAALGTATVTGTSFVYYEIDVTNYVAAEKAAGRNVVSFALHNSQSSNQYVWMRSREAGSNPPQLVITPHVTAVSLLPTVSTVALGASTTLTLTISSPQAIDTAVPIAATPSGIVSVPAQVTVPAGQTSAQVPVETLAYGQAGITASLNGSSASAGVNVVPPPVAVTALEPASFVMTVGAVSTFTVRINAAQIADTEIALAASNPSVLQVPASVIVPTGATSATFTVTGLAVGDSTITASANGTSRASSVHVSPQPAAIVSLLPTPLPLQQGATGSLTVTINVAQEAATTIALANSAPEVATVPESIVIAAGTISAQIAVTALSPGNSVVTASVNGTSAAATVEVTPPPPMVSALEPATLSLPKGTPGTLRVTVSRAPNVATPVALVSSDMSVASVPPQVNIPAGALFADFPVMPNAPGQASITASLNGGSASSTVTVGAAELVNLTVAPQAPVRYVGETVAFTATGLMTDGTSEDFTSRVTWSSSSTAVATINASGVASALAAGQTTIRASFTFTAAQTGQPVTVEQSTELSVQVQLAIHAVIPSSAEVGATVTLSGVGFDPVASNNQLVFRGIDNTTVPAAALTATTTAITVRVPPLAESGPITLTNSRGTVQSPPLTVTREQDFQLVVSPAALTVYQGASGTVQAQLSSTGTKSFTGLVTLSVQGLPAGVTASFAPAATLSAFQTGAITLAATTAVAPGNYPIKIQALFSEGGVPFLRSSTVTLTIANAAGVTALKGRFVTPEGRGIAGIIVRADIAANPQPQTTTDAAGNFQLSGLPAGTITFRFDATPANPLYPIWPYTTTVVANQVTVIPDWTIAPPPSDDKFTPIQANSTQDQIITDARYPGLAIKIPAGTTITGWDGVPKSRIAVERLDPDKLPVSAPPIPTKSVFQLYFGTPMGGLPSQPIPVTLPNDIGLDPGTTTELWYYDGSPMGGTGEWKQGGTGTVSADGKVIVTNPGSGIPRFCGVCGLPCFKNNQGGGGGPPPPSNSPPNNCGKPVTLAVGQELLTAQDLYIDGIVPLSVQRGFNPRDPYNNIAGTTLSLGLGWILNYDTTLLPFSSEQVRIILPGNARIDFTPDGAGAFEVKADPRFYGAKLQSPSSGVWELKFKDGRSWKFQQFGLIHWLVEQKDADGNALLIARTGSGKIQNVQGGQRSLAFAYGANGFINEVTDPIGRKVRFTYTTSGRIDTVTAPDDKLTRYTYVDDTEFPASSACPIPASGGVRLKTILRPGRTIPVTLHYGPGFRVLKETQEDGTGLRFAYTVVGACVTHVSNPAVPCTVNCPTVDSWENFQAGWRIVGGQITATTTIDDQGRSATQRFGASGLGKQVDDPQGQQYKYVRDAQNRVTAVTDPLGRTWRYAYDERGNRTRQIDPAGKVTDYTYDDKWNKLTSATSYDDANQPVTQTYVYDVNTGRLTRKTNPLGHSTTFQYNERGQLTSITDALNRVRTLSYNSAGDLITMRDALGNETLSTPDAVGRITAITDPLGYTTSSSFNANDQVTQVTDALQGRTRYAYGSRNEVTSITNPRDQAIESYVRDDRLRLLRRIDAKIKPEIYTYNSAGLVETFTNRKGQVTTFTYDDTGRVVRIQYPDGERRLTYDAVGRLASVSESPGTTVVYSYSSLDQVVQEIQDDGLVRNVIGYEYDSLGRRVRRTLNGGDPTDFTYDRASRLTSITYRSATTVYEWDIAGRLAKKTLPNGIYQTIEYDDADRVTALTYRKPDDTVIEAVSYTYDARGQRLSRSAGASSVFETPFTATYDEANRMIMMTTNPGTTSEKSFVLGYDDNGNLVSKNETANPSIYTTFVWDSRNRLTAIQSAELTASFKYDALGRRVERTVNGRTTRYVYDGPQAIVEITDGVPAALLTGLEVDEVLARYAQSGRMTYLQDALSSVIAQTKDDLTVQNYYSYSPYGETSLVGPDADNAIRYTGREHDGTGLYYYRARYYDPVLKRFVSEDPIGIAGGLNLYGYVGGDPVSLIDPTGNSSTCYSAGPNCSGAGTPGQIIKTPPGGGCLKAIWSGGSIVGWVPCDPQDPASPSQPPPPPSCPPGPPPPPVPPSTPPPATPPGVGWGGPGGPPPNGGKCYWGCIAASAGNFIVKETLLGIFWGGLEAGADFFRQGTIGVTSVHAAAAGAAAKAGRFITMAGGAYDLWTTSPEMCEKACLLDLGF